MANIEGVFDKHEGTRLKKVFSRARTDQGQSIESIESDSQQAPKKFRYLNDDDEKRESNENRLAQFKCTASPNTIYLPPLFASGRAT